MESRAKLNIDVVSHKFTSQPNRKKQPSAIRTSVAEKGRKQQISEKISKESTENIETNNAQKSIVEFEADHRTGDIEIDSRSSNVILAENNPYSRLLLVSSYEMGRLHCPELSYT